jgi:predicted DNA-binding transcriptional regulator AlpA
LTPVKVTCKVRRVQAQQVISIGGVAALLGVSRARADQLSREAGFPAPAYETPAGRVWSVREVNAWLRGRRRAQRASHR